MSETRVIPKLSALALVLFALSLWTYHLQHKRPTDLVLGQEFLPGLDVEKVSKIVIEGNSGKNKLVLTRQQNHFVLENFHDYFLDTEKINDFMYKVSSITVATKVQSNGEYQEKLKVSDKTFERKLTFFDGKGDTLTQFYIGDNGKPKGQYLRMANKEDVYLSEEFLHFSCEKDQFITKELIKVDEKNLAMVELKSPQEELKIIKEKDKDKEYFKIVTPSLPMASTDEGKIKTFISHLHSINLDDFFSQSEESVRNLEFSQVLRIALDDETSYTIKMAQKDSKYYLTLKMDLKNFPTEVEISQDDQKDKLQQVDQMIKKSTQAKEFNQRHQNFVYSISKYVYDNLVKNSKEFLKN